MIALLTKHFVMKILFYNMKFVVKVVVTAWLLVIVYNVLMGTFFTIIFHISVALSVEIEIPIWIVKKKKSVFYVLIASKMFMIGKFTISFVFKLN